MYKVGDKVVFNRDYTKIGAVLKEGTIRAFSYDAASGYSYELRWYGWIPAAAIRGLVKTSHEEGDIEWMPEPARQSNFHHVVGGLAGEITTVPTTDWSAAATISSSGVLIEQQRQPANISGITINGGGLASYYDQEIVSSLNQGMQRIEEGSNLETETHGV